MVANEITAGGGQWSSALKLSFGASIGVHVVALSTLVAAVHSKGFSPLVQCENRPTVLTVVLEPAEKPASRAATPVASAPPARQTADLRSPRPSLAPSRRAPEKPLAPTVHTTEPPPVPLNVPEASESELFWVDELTNSGTTTADIGKPGVRGAAESTERRPAGGGSGCAAGYLVNPKPNYPKEARRHRQEGTVLLQVLVSAEGLPLEIQVKQSSRFALLDQASLVAVRAWKFTPARVGQTPRASEIEVPIEFRLAPRGASCWLGSKSASGKLSNQ